MLYRAFDKNDILRIVRALAIFRPSLIALQMPMSEEDEVFIEKCFQRSLIVGAIAPHFRCMSLIELWLGAISGTRQTRVLQWYAYAGLASDRRDMSCRPGVLHADWLGKGGAHWAEEVCV